MPAMTNFHGLIPAIAVPFRPDLSVDEPGLRSFVTWLGRQPGVVGLMTNGHTGEVFSLTPRERVEVTRIVADATRGICPTVSSVVCEGIGDACEQALAAKEGGRRRSTSCRRTTGCASGSGRRTCWNISARSGRRRGCR